MPPFSVTSPSSVSAFGASRLGRSRSNTTYGGGSPVHNQYQAPMLQMSTKPATPLSISTAAINTGGNAQNAPIPSHTFSINWENVLMPSAWLTARMGMDGSVQSLQNAQRLVAQTPQLKALLAAIEENIIQLLTQAMATGCVYIFSDRTVQYVELSCSVFFPRLTACLRGATRGVFVVGVPDTDFSAQELADWKVNILRTVCHERIFAGQDLAKTHTSQGSRRFGLVALCASDLDVSASDQLAKLTPFAVTKSVKVAQQAAASLEEFAAQVQKLTRFVTEALAFNGPIRIAL
ncbi:hypothetical protein Gpo141_00008644 [Globisporangium polare]